MESGETHCSTQQLLFGSSLSQNSSSSIHRPLRSFLACLELPSPPPPRASGTTGTTGTWTSSSALSALARFCLTWARAVSCTRRSLVAPGHRPLLGASLQTCGV